MEATEIDKALEELENKAEQLRALYEQYFMGMERIEPLALRKNVERRIKLLRREQLRNTAQRFKFNTLVQRFNTMQQHWSRVVREIENGTYRRDVIRAAARFGEAALTALGKKKTKDVVAAVAKGQARAVDDDRPSLEYAFELEPDDLIEEEEEDGDEAPTPPKLEVPPVAALPPAYTLGLGQGDLPVVGDPSDRRAPPPDGTSGPNTPAHLGLGPLPQPIPPPRRSAGLRWGEGAASAADPASAIRPAAGDVRKRVAELAAEMGVPRDQEDLKPPGFGELDLDFDDSAARRPAAPAAAPRIGAAAPRVGLGGAKPVGPLPAVSAPMARAAGPQGSAPTAAPTGGFGVLDIALEGEAPAAIAARPALRDPSPSSPGSGIRPGGNRSPTTTPARPAPASDGDGHDGDLPDQRIRQIYSKYVETKRSTQESTAGVTFEKLAASLRAQATKLKSAHPTRSIDYEVVVKDGKTHLKPVLR